MIQLFNQCGISCNTIPGAAFVVCKMLYTLPHSVWVVSFQVGLNLSPVHFFCLLNAPPQVRCDSALLTLISRFEGGVASFRGPQDLTCYPGFLVGKGLPQKFPHYYV